MPHDIARNERPRPIDNISHDRLEFDYDRNALLHDGKVIHLSPHESDILSTLLANRGRVTPLGTLIQRIYGLNEPDTADVSIRVVIHSLRKKLLGTGIVIKSQARIGYEIDAPTFPQSSQQTAGRHLTGKILLALNAAKAAGQWPIAAHLQAALEIAKARQTQ